MGPLMVTNPARDHLTDPLPPEGFPSWPMQAEADLTPFIRTVARKRQLSILPSRQTPQQALHSCQMPLPLWIWRSKILFQDLDLAQVGVCHQSCLARNWMTYHSPPGCRLSLRDWNSPTVLLALSRLLLTQAHKMCMLRCTNWMLSVTVCFGDSM